MSDILNKTIVLVLNRNWQAINIRTPADAFCQIATNAATAFDIELGDDVSAALRPVTGTSGSRCRCAKVTTPCTPRTAHRARSAPTVIVAVNYARC